MAKRNKTISAMDHGIAIKKYIKYFISVPFLGMALIVYERLRK
tara:strand:+ start:362 stop:490 length:129 start_codon:yes stop_codon:yes gene_type:complete